MRCLCLGVALESSTKFRCRLPPSVAEGLLLLLLLLTCLNSNPQLPLCHVSSLHGQRALRIVCRHG